MPSYFSHVRLFAAPWTVACQTSVFMEFSRQEHWWKWSRSVSSDSLQPMDYSPPSSSIHGILQARILEWVAISFSRGSSWPRDQTHISCVSCTGSCFFTTVSPGKPRCGLAKVYKIPKLMVDVCPGARNKNKLELTGEVPLICTLRPSRKVLPRTEADNWILFMKIDLHSLGDGLHAIHGQAAKIKASSSRTGLWPTRHRLPGIQGNLLQECLPALPYCLAVKGI